VAEETANILTDIMKDMARQLRSIKGSLGAEIDRKCDAFSQDFLKIDEECIMRNNQAVD